MRNIINLNITALDKKRNEFYLWTIIKKEWETMNENIKKEIPVIIRDFLDDKFFNCFMMGDSHEDNSKAYRHQVTLFSLSGLVKVKILKLSYLIKLCYDYLNLISYSDQVTETFVEVDSDFPVTKSNSYIFYCGENNSKQMPLEKVEYNQENQFLTIEGNISHCHLSVVNYLLSKGLKVDKIISSDSKYKI